MPKKPGRDVAPEHHVRAARSTDTSGWNVVAAPTAGTAGGTVKCLHDPAAQVPLRAGGVDFFKLSGGEPSQNSSDIGHDHSPLRVASINRIACPKQEELPEVPP